MAVNHRKSQRKHGRKQQAKAKRQPSQGWLASLGVMRISLVILAIGLMAISPKPGTPMGLDGYQVVTTLVAPALAPIVFMVLMLDMMMGRIFMGSASGAERERYRRIAATNLAVGIILVLWWAPYFVRLMKP